MSNVKSEERLNVSAISSRIDEHVNRGLIIKSDNGCKLSWIGKFYLQTAELMAKIFRLSFWNSNRVQNIDIGFELVY